MSEIHVKFESLASGQQGIMNSFNKLTQTISDLEADLNPMVSTWSGSAQESYVMVKKQWHEAADALSLVLRQIGVAVGDAHQNYSAAERAAQSNWA
jgi:WXG100 family type VII secretion target